MRDGRCYFSSSFMQVSVVFSTFSKLVCVSADQSDRERTEGYMVWEFQKRIYPGAKERKGLWQDRQEKKGKAAGGAKRIKVGGEKERKVEI